MKTVDEKAEAYIEDKDWDVYFVPYPNDDSCGYIDGNPIAIKAYKAGHKEATDTILELARENAVLVANSRSGAPEYTITIAKLEELLGVKK